MSTEAFETLVIGQLEAIRKDRDADQTLVREALREVKAEIVANQTLTSEAVRQSTITNGRVTKNEARLASLEEWKKGLDGERHDHDVRWDERKRWFTKAAQLLRAISNSRLIPWLLMAAGVLWATAQ